MLPWIKLSDSCHPYNFHSLGWSRDFHKLVRAAHNISSLETESWEFPLPFPSSPVPWEQGCFVLALALLQLLGTQDWPSRMSLPSLDSLSHIHTFPLPMQLSMQKRGWPKEFFFAHQMLIIDISVCFQPHASFQFSEQILFPDIYPTNVGIVIIMFSYICGWFMLFPLLTEYA